MSQAALLLAVCDAIRTEFSLTAASCEAGFDGQPKPGCGELYIAVHPLNWNGVSGDWDLGEEYGVGVTVTIRTAWANQDRWGIAVLTAPGKGLEARVRKIITAIHHNQDVRIAANSRITGGGGNILTPLVFVRVEPPRPVGPSWFSAAMPDPDQPGVVPECGVSQTIIFGRCQRVQSIPDME